MICGMATPSFNLSVAMMLSPASHM